MKRTVLFLFLAVVCLCTSQYDVSSTPTLEDAGFDAQPPARTYAITVDPTEGAGRPVRDGRADALRYG